MEIAIYKNSHCGMYTAEISYGHMITNKKMTFSTERRKPGLLVGGGNFTYKDLKGVQELAGFLPSTVRCKDRE